MDSLFRLLKVFAFYWAVFFVFLWTLNRFGVSSLLLNKVSEVLLWLGAWLISLLNWLGAEILMTTWHEMVYSSVALSALVVIGLSFFHKSKHL